MVRKLIDWAVANAPVVLILTAALAIGGGYAFTHVNIEAYPDPAPAIIEVVAQYPGATAEEVERQVTIPLEVALAGMRGLEIDAQQVAVRPVAHSQPIHLCPRLRTSQAGRAQPAGDGQPPARREAAYFARLAHRRNPAVHPGEPARSRHRQARLHAQRPEGRAGLRHSARTSPRAASRGCRRDRRRPSSATRSSPTRTGCSNTASRSASFRPLLRSANANGSGDNLTQGQAVVVVRSLGLIGRGQDPAPANPAMTDPGEAARYLRAEEARRLVEIRQVVVASVNNVPVRVDQVVDGGPFSMPTGRRASPTRA